MLLFPLPLPETLDKDEPSCSEAARRGSVAVPFGGTLAPVDKNTGVAKTVEVYVGLGIASGVVKGIEGVYKLGDRCGTLGIVWT
jgi:hypothetical protein